MFASEQVNANTIVLTILAVATAYKAYSDNRLLKKIKNTGEDTHKLVNNAMGIQLRATAVAKRSLANNTKNPLDIQDAEMAEAAYNEHMRGQAKVDKAVKDRADS